MIIYCLLDPSTNNSPKYVGKTSNINQRLKNHLNPARYKNTHKFNWIKKLKRLDLKPIVLVLEKVNISNWKSREKYWIRYFIKKGYKLTNKTIGGDGLTVANQTSFKKGHISWNKGTANTNICIVCNKIFKASPSLNQKTCGYKCASVIRTGHEHNQFKKGVIPWNLGLSKKLKPDKNVYQYTKNKSIFIKKWNTAKEASLNLNINEEGIGQCCRNKSKSSGGFWWSYKLINNETKIK